MQFIKYTLFIGISFFLVSSFSTDPIKPKEDKKIMWMSWDEAMAMNKKEPKKIFVDLYTDWCGWCKKMDKSTFVDPSVVDYMNENFYAVKFDAEGKDPIEFNGTTFKYIKGGRRGVHELANALLNGKLSYPSFVMLNEDFERIIISPGFKKAPEMLKQLKFAGEEKYKDMSWNAYQANN